MWYTGKKSKGRKKMTDKMTGNSDRITREYLDSLLLEMRHIDAVKPDTGFTLYGERFATPIMTAALSHLDNVHEKGMVEMAKGAKMAEAVCFAGMGEKEELEEMTKTGARVVKIIKPYADNQVIFDKIAHAESCGVLAVGMDIDHAFNGNGDYDTVLGLEMRPKSLEEIRQFVQATSLPFLIKGVLSERDAYKCLQAGVRGIVVSHHHGIMDYALPPLKILPSIVKVTGGEIPVFVDCGIAGGMDAFKALALGADGVCVGRALMEPLRDNGAKGLCDAILAMNGELAGVMARTGCPDLSHMDADVIWH
jgi:isopentenyl diphosphate isomerase/L-lactate dehydrogenase-like FMN-dependent dehydrogenase